MQNLCVFATLCYQKPEIIEFEFPQRQYAEEGDADVAVYVLTQDGLPPLSSD